jgi:hypothetical protein
VVPDILDALQNADGGKLACRVVAVGEKAFDKGSDGRELVTLMGAIESQEMPGKRASVDVEQLLAIVGTGLGEKGANDGQASSQRAAMLSFIVRIRERRLTAPSSTLLRFVRRPWCIVVLIGAATALAWFLAMRRIWPVVGRSSIPVALIAIRANRLARATLDGLSAQAPLFRLVRLLGDVGNTVLAIAGEIVRRDVAAEVAVEAGAIDIERAPHIVG